jgi:hypothetical protein
MRGNRPNLLQEIELGPDPRLAALEEKVSRLEGELADARKLSEEVSRSERDLNDLRGLLMAFVAHFAHSTATRGRDIERRLIELMRERLPEGRIPDLVHGDSEIADRINKLLDDVSRRR